MVNGVIEIVAGVLFAFVYITGDRSVIWLWIGGAYCVFGVLNLLAYAIRNKSKLRAAKKQAEKSAKEAQALTKSAQQATPAPETVTVEPVQLVEE